MLQIATVSQEWDLTKGNTCQWTQRWMRKTLCPRKPVMSAKSTATLRKKAGRREVFMSPNPLQWVNLTFVLYQILSIWSHVYYAVNLHVGLGSVKLELAWNLMTKLMDSTWQRQVNKISWFLAQNIRTGKWGKTLRFTVSVICFSFLFMPKGIRCPPRNTY